MSARTMADGGYGVFAFFGAVAAAVAGAVFSNVAASVSGLALAVLFVGMTQLKDPDHD